RGQRGRRRRRGRRGRRRGVCRRSRLRVRSGREPMTTPAARALVLAGCAWLLAASAPLTGARGGAQVAAVPAPLPAPTVRATLDRYCLGCHNDRLRTGG